MLLYNPFLTWIGLAVIPFYVGLSLAVTPVLRRLEELQAAYVKAATRSAT